MVFSESQKVSHGTKIGSDSCLSVDVCPELLMAAIGLAGVAGAFFLYQAITMNGKRRKRSFHHHSMSPLSPLLGIGILFLACTVVYSVLLH